jgi:hypothetical protein
MIILGPFNEPVTHKRIAGVSSCFEIYTTEDDTCMNNSK